MILSKRKCPLCGSQIMASSCGNPIFRTTYAIACSNINFSPMPSEHSEPIPVLQRSADDLFAQGLIEEEVVDRFALEYIQKVQEKYGKITTEEEEKVKE